MLFSELLIVDAVHWHMIRAAQMLVAMVCCIINFSALRGDHSIII